MSSSPKIHRKEIMPIALELRQRLLPACEKVVIAGSLRRGLEMAGDIELVLLPRWDKEMIYDSKRKAGVPVCTALEDVLKELRPDFALDTALRRNGPRYKRFVTLGGKLPVEMYLADGHCFGNTLAIRTGDADFSRMLVTHVAKGGLMPGNRRQFGGHLHDRPLHLPDFTQKEAVNPETDAIVSCLTEQAFFDALGIDMPHPSERTRDMAEILRR